MIWNLNTYKERVMVSVTISVHLSCWKRCPKIICYCISLVTCECVGENYFSNLRKMFSHLPVHAFVVLLIVCMSCLLVWINILFKRIIKSHISIRCQLFSSLIHIYRVICLGLPHFLFWIIWNIFKVEFISFCAVSFFFFSFKRMRIH